MALIVMANNWREFPHITPFGQGHKAYEVPKWLEDAVIKKLQSMKLDGNHTCTLIFHDNNFDYKYVMGPGAGPNEEAYYSKPHYRKEQGEEQAEQEWMLVSWGEVPQWVKTEIPKLRLGDKKRYEELRLGETGFLFGKHFEYKITRVDPDRAGDWEGTHWQIEYHYEILRRPRNRSK